MLVNIFLICGASLAVVHTFEDKPISQWLADNGYSILVSLLKQAGLYDTLNGPGAYTMFAPSNAAFSKVPQSTLSSLVSDKSLLVSVLKKHLLPGFAMTPTLRDGDVKTSLNGTDLTFKLLPNGVLLVNNDVVSEKSSDIILNNGVVHVINSVLLPITDKFGEILLKRNEFSTLSFLLAFTDLAPTLLGRSVTLFAPTNDAFQSVSPSLPELSLPGSLEVYKKILRNHVVNGVFPTNTLHNGEVVTALGGRTLHVSINSSGVLVTPSGSITTGKLTETDIQAINGLIHVVDHVLIPQGLKRSAPAK